MLITDLKNGEFNLKIAQNLTNYLSCRVLENQAQNEVLILQLRLINKLRDDEVFGKGTYKLLVLQDSKLFAPMKILS
jgi:hypothetical protein